MSSLNTAPSVTAANSLESELSHLTDWYSSGNCVCLLSTTIWRIRFWSLNFWIGEVIAKWSWWSGFGRTCFRSSWSTSPRCGKQSSLRYSLDSMTRIRSSLLLRSTQTSSIHCLLSPSYQRKRLPMFSLNAWGKPIVHICQYRIQN